MDEVRLVRMLKRVWDDLAYDILGGEGEVLDRESVIDVVLDRASFASRDREASRAFEKLSSKSQERLAAKAFPHKLYGI